MLFAVIVFVVADEQEFIHFSTLLTLLMLFILFFMTPNPISQRKKLSQAFISKYVQIHLKNMCVKERKTK